MKTHSQICIIDDDAISVFGLKRAIATAGCTPDLSVFENGLDALENFKECLKDDDAIPSLIFVDLNMPVMDGWDFMEEFTKLIPSPSDMPDIYVMTSSIDVKDLETAKSYGLEAQYLMKPVSATVLEGILGLGF
ncbi:MAG: response regulator [Pricia sp.]